MDYTIDFNPDLKVGDQLDESRLYNAILWCQEEFGIDGFQIDNQFPSWRYTFRFQQPEQATHFALKWM